MTSEAKTLNAVAKYDISAEALMIDEDRTKYTLLSEKDYYSCNNRYMPGTPGCEAQSVTCLVTDAKLTADPGVGRKFDPGPVPYFCGD